jgi:hypothetical protein
MQQGLSSAFHLGVATGLLVCSMSFASVLEDAQSGIGQHRKADVAIEFRLPEGTGLACSTTVPSELSRFTCKRVRITGLRLP